MATSDNPAAAEPLAHSNWKARREYAFVLTITLLVVLVLSIVLDRHVDPVAWLISLVVSLFLVAPSAEQATKMLATAAALRAGVSFRSTAEVDPSTGGVMAETVATGAPAPDTPTATASTADGARATPATVGKGDD